MVDKNKEETNSQATTHKVEMQSTPSKAPRVHKYLKTKQERKDEDERNKQT